MNAVEKEGEKINKEGLMEHVQIEKIASQADYIEHGILGITDNLLIGALFATSIFT